MKYRSGKLLAGAMLLALTQLPGCDHSAGSNAPAGAQDIQRLGVQGARSAALAARPAQWPSLNGPVLAELGRGTPELQAMIPALLAADRSAIQQVADKAMPRVPTADLLPSGRSFPASVAIRTGPSSTLFDWLIPPAQAAEAGADGSTLQAVAVAHMVTTFLGAAADAGAGAAGTESLRSEFSGKTGEKASFVVRTERDGRVTTELTSEIAVPLFLLEANSRTSITTRGLCPDTDGKVAFTIRLDSGGHKDGGINMAFNHTREVHVAATVNDDAEIADALIETKYGDRVIEPGRKAYVEGVTAWRRDSATGSLSVSSHKATGTSQATSADMALLNDGATQALVLADSALFAARSRWQSGTCIRIKAESPGRIQRRAVTRIPVSVIHRLDSSDVPAKVKVELRGGESVTPAQIPRTPDTLVHTAPDAKIAKMSIRLTARSRRGMAEDTLKLLINEGAFHAEGGAGDFHGYGLICSLAEPFEISGSGVTVTFTPTSEQGGTYTYDGNMSGFHLFGQGTFKVIYKDGAPVQIFATGPGNVDNARGAGDEHYTLTPAQDYRCDDKLN